MDWLNYHHLLYFWTVARHGSIVGASRELRLAQPTISGQVHRLEEVLGEKLFERHGRNLQLTEAGLLAFRYAEEIFSLGREFTDALQGRGGARPLRLMVGVADVLPASLVRRFLEPALALKRPVHVVCRADKSVDEFLAELAMHRLDVVLADAPAGPAVAVRAFSHLLGECGTTFLAERRVATSLRGAFPAQLRGAPFLMPGPSSAVRRALDRWFVAQGIQPRVVAEFDDSALAKDFARAGRGVVVIPSVIEDEVVEQYGLSVLGRSDAVTQQFFAISVERKVRHVAVNAICEAARKDIFTSQ